MIFLQSEGKVIILRAGDAYDVLRLSQQETILYLTHMILKPAYGICTFYSEKNAFCFLRNRKAVRPFLLLLYMFFGMLIRRKGPPTLR